MSSTKPRLAAAERRLVLLEAARAAFARSGFAGATIRDIAAAADVNEALVYRHFESKEQLFEEAVMAPIDEAVRDVVERPFPPIEPGAGNEVLWQRCRAYVRDLLGAMREVAPLIGVLLFTDQASGTRYFRDKIEPILERLVERTTETLEVWSPREFDVALVQRMVFAQCWFLAIDERLGSGGEHDLDELADQLVGILFDGIARS